MKHMTVLTGALMLLLTAACGGGDDDNKNEPAGGTTCITVSTTQFDFSAEGGSGSFTLTSPGEWDASASETWVKLQKEGSLSTTGKVSLTVNANPTTAERTATVTLRSGTARASVSVTQKGKDPEEIDPNIDVPEGYTLVWSDEFDGSELNRSEWTHEVQNSGWVNNELQNYVNTSYDGKFVTEVSDGTLKINCFKASNGKVYSARIYARVNQGWRYGIFEARIKLPKGKGTWPAFWMMPVNNDWNTTPWPRCGEIDIMEEVGYHPDYTSSSMHCESYNHVMGTQKTAERYTKGAEGEFHVYRLEWTADYIRTYVDGKMLLNFANDKKNNFSTWPFTRAFYPILNLAWGGDWGGAQGVNEAVLPVTMEVDYVRVFQQ